MEKEYELISAAKEGQVEIVMDLLRYSKVDMNAKDEEGWTALHMAAFNGNTAVVEVLCQQDLIEVNTQTKKGWTALHWAAFQGHAAVVEILCQQDLININAQIESDWTALHWAAFQGHAAVVEILCQQPSIDVNIQKKNGQTALHVAVRYGHVDIVKMLCQQSKENINIQDEDGWTALHWAASKGHTAVVEILCQQPTLDVRIKNKEGHTSLYLAASLNHIPIVTTLLKTSQSLGDALSELQKATALHTLPLSSHQLKIEDVPFLTPLVSTHPSLTSLNISHIPGLGQRKIFNNSGFQDLLNAVAQSRSIKTLHAAGLGLTNSDIKSLGEVLEQNTSLQEVWLWEKSVGVAKAIFNFNMMRKAEKNGPSRSDQRLLLIHGQVTIGVRKFYQRNVQISLNF